MEASFVPQFSHGIMDEEGEELGTPSSSSSATSNDSSSSSSELTDDATSPASPPRPLPSSSGEQRPRGAPYEMSSLMAQLPFKRGLSRHFQGKSQSFTSLCNVRYLEDLAKPGRPPHKKKLKPCKSYGSGLDSHKPHSPVGCSKAIAKKPSRGALSTSLVVKRPAGSLLGSSRPPVPPHRSSKFPTQTLLFA